MRTGCGGLVVMFGLALGWLFVGFVLMAVVGAYLQQGLAPDDPERLGLGEAAFAFGMAVGLVGFTASVGLLRRRAAARGAGAGSPPQTPAGRIPGGVIVQPNTLRADAPPRTDLSRRLSSSPPSANVSLWAGELPRAQPAAVTNALGTMRPTAGRQPQVQTQQRRVAAVLCLAGGGVLVVAVTMSSMGGLAVAAALGFAGGVAYGIAGAPPRAPANAFRGAAWAIAPFALTGIAAVVAGASGMGPVLLALGVLYLCCALAIEAGVLAYTFAAALRRR